jgi:hypothetical protein
MKRKVRTSTDIMEIDEAIGATLEVCQMRTYLPCTLLMSDVSHIVRTLVVARTLQGIGDHGNLPAFRPARDSSKPIAGDKAVVNTHLLALVKRQTPRRLRRGTKYRSSKCRRSLRASACYSLIFSRWCREQCFEQCGVFSNKMASEWVCPE